MKTSSENLTAREQSLWDIIHARDRALIQTCKAYERRCTELQEACESTKEYLKTVEQSRNEAQASTQQTVAFLRQVEEDSAARLASIKFHQEKLKTAYADLERNVAYLKSLEAEIRTHVKVSAEKDAIIASLNQQLQEFKQNSD